MNTRPARTLVAIRSMLIALASTLQAENYYVAPDGNDSAPGTKDLPFKTVQKAAERAKPGDSCHIAPGVYRETVTPAHSGTQENPIVFRASGEGTVTITGTDPVCKWEKHPDGIYKAEMEWSLGRNNQIFFDGKPLQEARWPDDRDGDPMTPDGAKIEGGSTDHIVCSRFPANWQREDLKGAVVWAIPQSAWSSWTAMVSDYDPAAEKVFFPDFTGNWWVEAMHNPKSGKGGFYISGALKLLDAPGEWFYDEADKMLYLQAPQNADPNDHAVEAKSRPLGLDLKNKSWIVIEGINLLGCTLDMDKASHCLVKNMQALHISHTRGGKTISQLDEKSGIYISGHHNRLTGCEIACSAGNGVSLGGTDNAIVNCWIHHIDYMGAYCSPVSMQGLRHLVSHNTITDTGRDGIKLGGAEHLIQFNDIACPGRICHDLGAIYSGGMDGGNTRIRYNFVHDNSGSAANIGIYLDNYMKNYIVDHNVIWNTGTGIRLNRPTGFCMILNNTVFKDINNSWGPWKGQKVQWGCHVMNNLCAENILMNPEVVVRANLIQPNLSRCFDTNSRTRGTSNPGKAKGIPVAGITPAEDVDIGAYQHSEPDWRAGHDFNNSPEPVYTPAGNEPLRNCISNAAFEYVRYHKEANETVDPLIHWTKTHAAAAVVEYHEGFNDPPANARDSIHGSSVTLGGDGDNGIEQKITGLLPDTPYYFSGYVRHGDDVSVEFGVRISDKTAAQETSRSIKLEQGQTWRFVPVWFKTGPDDTSATVTIVKRGAGEARVDDTGVVAAGWGLRAE